MAAQAKQVYEFGPFRLDLSQRLLLREGEPVQISPKPFHILLALVEQAGSVVTKDELMRRVWPDTVVEEQNLSKNIFLLRKALCEDPSCQYIENIPKVGYRFLPGVRRSNNVGPPLIVETHERVRIVATEEETQDETLAVPTPCRNHAAFDPGSSRTGLRKSNALILAVVLVATIFAVAAFWWSRGNSQPPEPGIKSLAVLPFKPLSHADSDQYLELGIADTLITRLSSLNQITVRPISAIRGYTDFGQDPLAAGRELRVDSVLEGSIQRSEDRVRVTVRLWRVADGKSLWSYQCNEQCSDLFELQSVVSERVATALTSSLSGKDRELLARRYTQNQDAYEAYLRGRFFWNKRDTEGCKKAVEFFNRAIEIDPNYALAYSGIADACWFINDSWLSKTETEARMNGAIRKALALDDSLAEAHASLGLFLQNYEWDWKGAESEYRRAIELNPNYATGHHWYGEFLGLMGRFDDGLAQIDRAQEIDPLSLSISTDKAKILYLAGRYDQAIDQCRKTLEIDAGFALARFWLSWAHAAKGEYKEALASLKELTEPDDFLLTTAQVGYVYGLMGNKAEARKILAQLNEQAGQKHVPYTCFILVYLGLGDKDRTFEWMEKAYKAHSVDLNCIKVASGYDPLRSDPRFQDLLGRLRFPE